MKICKNWKSLNVRQNRLRPLGICPTILYKKFQNKFMAPIIFVRSILFQSILKFNKMGLRWFIFCKQSSHFVGYHFITIENIPLKDVAAQHYCHLPHIVPDIICKSLVIAQFSRWKLLPRLSHFLFLSRKNASPVLAALLSRQYITAWDFGNWLGRW